MSKSIESTITSLICKAISTEFGDEYEVYKEHTRQGAVEPCFLVLAVNTTVKKQYVGASGFNQLYNISFLPDVGNRLQKINEVLPRLIPTIENVRIDDNYTLHGYNVKADIEGEILVVTVEYRTSQRIADTADDITDYQAALTLKD